MGGNKKYLFIDTETTGFPRKDWKICKCNIVEIGWIITNSKLEILEEYYTLIKPVGFYIGRKSIHGIKHSHAMKYGKGIYETLEKLIDVIDRIDVIVGHNVAFDLRVIGNMMLKLDFNVIIDREIKCTYKMTRKKLSLAYQDITGKQLKGHRVKEDIMATRRIFKALSFVLDKHNSIPLFAYSNIEHQIQP